MDPEIALGRVIGLNYLQTMIGVLSSLLRHNFCSDTSLILEQLGSVIANYVHPYGCVFQCSSSCIFGCLSYNNNARIVLLLVSTPGVMQLQLGAT